MKTTFLSIGLALGFGASVMAQGGSGPETHYEFRNFLAVQSIRTGTNSTFGFTNLNSLVAQATAGYSGTNTDGTILTNALGSGIVSGNSNNTINVFKDIDLWTLRNGDWPVVWTTNNQQAEYLNLPIGLARLEVRGGSTNAAGTGTIHLRFVPMYDGTNESTLAADVWDVAFVPNGTTFFCLTTNLPMYKWVGARRLRLREEFNNNASNQGDSFLNQIGVSLWIP